MRIGVFSGTFDPVHDGHIKAAQAAVVEHDLAKVLFVPEAEPRLKRDVTPFEHRWAMLELALAELGNSQLWQASQVQHTDETLREIQLAHPDAELVLLVGSDLAPARGRWPDGTLINSKTSLVVLPRTEHSSASVRAGTTAGGVPLLVLRYIKKHGLYTQK